MTDRAAHYMIPLIFVLLVSVFIATIAGFTFPYHSLVIQILLGGFIGGITNKIAIVMMFERKWFLPGSGVLLKKHKEIIHSLAETAEKHLVNSEMLQAEMRKLLRPVNIEKAEQVINNVIDEFRDDVSEYLGSQRVHNEIRDALKTKLGFLGKFLNVTRIKEYDEMADAIVREIKERIGLLRLSKSMIARAIQKVGTLEDFLFKPGNELVVRHYHTDSSLSQLFFDRIDIKGMVTEKLSAYEPSRVRDIIEANIRSHLLWLEIFGVLLGMLFSGTLYLALRTTTVSL